MMKDPFTGLVDNTADELEGSLLGGGEAPKTLMGQMFGPLEVAEMENWSPKVGTVDYSLDFGSSKYDKQAKTIADVENIDDYRGRMQSGADKVVNGSINFIGSTAMYTAGGLTGLTVGAVQGIYNEAFGDGENSIRYLYDNTMFRFLDGLEEDMRETLPMYYSNVEREKGLMSQMGTLNFWMNDFAHGMAFIAGAVLTETIVSSATGFVGTAANTGRLAAQASKLWGRSQRAAGQLNRGGRLAKTFEAGRSALGANSWEALKTGRQLWTGAGFEAAFEAREAYDSSVDQMLTTHYSDRIEEAAALKGGELTTEEKLQLLSPEERKGIDDASTGLANGLFAGNLVLVGIGNMVTLGHLYAPKTLQRFSRPIGDNVSQMMAKRGISENARKWTMGTASWMGRSAYEGLVEEGGQGTMQRVVHDYAVLSELGADGTIAYTRSIMEAFEDSAKETYLTDSGLKEVLIGSLASALGLPGAGFGMSRDVREEGDRIEGLNDRVALEKKLQEWEKLKELRPDLANMDVRAYMMSLVAAASPMIEKAESERNTRLAKDLKARVFADLVLGYADMGMLHKLDDIHGMVEESSAEDLKAWLGYDPNMSETEIKARVQEVKAKTAADIKSILETKNKVDREFLTTDRERTSGFMNKGGRGWWRKELIRNLAFAEQAEKRISDMTTEMSTLMGMTVVPNRDTYDSISFMSPDNSEKVTIDLGETNVGRTVGEQIEETEIRIAEMEKFAYGYNMDPQVRDKKLADLKLFLAKLKEVDNPANNMVGIFKENGSGLDGNILKDWSERDPENYKKNIDQVKVLMEDLRGLRGTQQSALDTYNLLKDPNFVKFHAERINTKRDAILKKSKADSKTAEEKKTTERKPRSEWELLKEKISSYRSELNKAHETLLARIEETESDVEVLEEMLAELAPALKLAGKKPKQNKFTLRSGESKRQFTRKELFDEFARQEAEVLSLREESVALQAQAMESKLFLEETLQILELLKDTTQDPTKADFGNITAAIQLRMAEKSISEPQAYAELVEETLLEAQSIQDFLENSGVEERLNALEQLIHLLKSFAERHPDVDVWDLDGRWKEVAAYYKGMTVAELETELEGLRSQLKEQKEKQAALVQDVILMRVFQVLNDLRKFTPPTGGSIDFEGLEDELSIAKYDKEKDLFLPDIDEGMGQTRTRHKGFALDSGELVKGAIEQYADLLRTEEETLKVTTSPELMVLSEKTLEDNIHDLRQNPNLTEKEKANLELLENTLKVKKHKNAKKLVESQLTWFNWMSAEGSNVLNSHAFKGKVYGTVAVFVHSGNVPASLKKDLDGTFFEKPAEDETEISKDRRDIKVVLATTYKDPKTKKTVFKWVRDSNKRLVFTSLNEPFYENHLGKPRYTNKNSINKLGIAKKEEDLRAYRNEILKNDALVMTNITYKSPGTLRKLSDKELAESGLNFADNAVIIPQELSRVSILAASPKKNTEDGKPNDLQVLKFGNVRITLRRGELAAFDPSRQMPIPMRRAKLSEETADNLLLLLKKLFVEYEMHFESLQNAYSALDMAKSTPLQLGKNSRPLYSHIQDLVYTYNKPNERYSLSIGSHTGTLAITYGPAATVLTGEDFADPVKVGLLKEFLLDKYHNVNTTSLNGTVKNTNQKFTSNDVGWVNFQLTDTLEVSPDSPVYKGYNEYLLQRQKGKKGAPDYAPLRTVMRDVKSSKLAEDFGNYDDPRAYGAYIRVNMGAKVLLPIAFKTVDLNAEEEIGDEFFGGTDTSNYDQEFEVGEDIGNTVASFDPLAAQENAFQQDSGNLEQVFDDPNKPIGDIDALLEGTGVEYIDPNQVADDIDHAAISAAAAIKAAKQAAEDAAKAVVQPKSLLNLSSETEAAPEVLSAADQAELDAKIQRLMDEDPNLPTFSMLQYQAEEDPLPEDLLAELEQAFGMRGLDVQLFKGLLDSKDGKAVAALRARAEVLLSTLAPGGAIFHEAFHDFSIYGISKEDRALLYNMVRRNVGSTTTYIGAEKAFSELTDTEAEEWLAEAFRYKVLHGSYEGYVDKTSKDDRNMFQRFMDTVSAWVRGLLKKMGLGDSFQFDGEVGTIEDILDGLEKGKYRDLQNDSNSMGMYTMLNSIEGYTNKFARGMVRSMSAYVQNRLYDPFVTKGVRVAMTHAKLYNARGDKNRSRELWLFYDVVIKDMIADLRTLQAQLKSSRTAKNKERLAGINEALGYFEKTPQKDVLKELGMLHFRILTESTADLEDLYYDESRETEEWTRDFVDERSALEESATEATPKEVKIMLSTIIRPGKFTSIGLPDVYDMPVLVKQMYNLMAGKMSFDAQKAKMLELKEEGKHPWISTILDVVDINPEGMNFEDIQLRTAFRAAFAKTKLQIAMTKVAENGDIYTIDPSEQLRVFKIQGQWSARLRGYAVDTSRSYIIKDKDNRIVFRPEAKFDYTDHEGIEMNLNLLTMAKRLERTQSIDEALNVLRLLGIEFTDKAEVKAYLSSSEAKKQLFEDIYRIFEKLNAGDASLADFFNRDEEGDVVARMNRLVKMEIKTDPNVEHQFMNAKRKMSYSVIEPHLYSIVQGLGYAALEKYYDPKTNPMTTNSLVLNAWKKDESLAPEVYSMAGMGSELLDSRGKMFENMGAADVLTVNMNALMEGIAVLIRPAEQKTEFGIKFHIKYPDTIEEALPVLRGYLYDEIAETAVNGIKGKNIKGYEKQIGDLRLMSGLLAENIEPGRDAFLTQIRTALLDKKFLAKVRKEVKELGESPSLKKEIEENLRSEIDAALEAGIKRDAEVLDDDLVEFGLLSATKGAGHRNLYAISPKHLGKTGTLHTEPEVVRALTKYSIRHIVAKNEMFKVYFRDPAFFTDMFKRMKGSVSTKIPADTASDMLRWLGTDPNLHMDTENKTYSGLTIKEPIHKLEGDLLKMYEQYLSEEQFEKLKKDGIEYADGMFIVSLPTYRAFSILTNDWVLEQEDLYWKMMADTTGKIVHDSEATFQSGKYNFFGPTIIDTPEGELHALGFQKMSVIPVYKQMAHMFEGEVFENILTLGNMMDTHKVSSLIIPSGMKVGVPTSNVQVSALTTLENADGQGNTLRQVVNPDESEVAMEAKVNFDLRFLGRQMPVKGKPKRKAAPPVQARAHVLADTHLNGEAHILYADTIRTYNSALTELSYKYFDKALKDYGITQVSTPNGVKYELAQESYDELLRSFEQEGARKGIGAALLDTLEYLSERKGPFKMEHFVDRFRMEAMHYSGFSKSVLKPKLHGDMLVQIPLFGFEIVRTNIGTLKSADLKVYDRGGKWVIETYMPHYFVEFLKPGDTVTVKNGELVINGVAIPGSEDLLKAVGIRIPTDGIHSVEIFEIKGFLPKHAGAKIVVPPAVVFKSGSDFDIDKLTMLMYNYYLGANDTPKRHTFHSDLEAWYLDNMTAKVRRFMYDMQRYVALQNEIVGLEVLSRETDEIADLFLRSFPGLIKDQSALIPSTEAERLEGEQLAELVAELEGIKKFVSEFMLEEDGMLHPRPFNDWRAENPTATVYSIQSIKQLENGFLEYSIKLLSDAARKEQFLKPVALPNLEAAKNKLLTMFKSAGVELVDLEIIKNFHTETRPGHQAKVAGAFIAADKVISIAAVTSKHHVQSQVAGTRLNMNTIYKLPDDNLIRPILWFADQQGTFQRALTEDGDVHGDPTVPLGLIKNSAGEYISELLSEFLNLAIDVVKNPYLHVLNVTPGNAPAVFTLLRAGVSLDTVLMFINQPIIRNYMAVTAVNSSMVRMFVEGAERDNDAAVYAKVLRNFEPAKDANVSAEKHYLTDAELETMLSKPVENLTDTEKALQHQILNSYLAYLQLGSDMTAVVQAQSLDTNLIKSRGHARLLRAMYANVLKAGVFPNVERILEDNVSFFGGMRYYLEQADEVFRDLFQAEGESKSSFQDDYDRYKNDRYVESTYRQIYSTFLHMLAHRNNRLPMDEKLRVLESVENFYMTMILQNVEDAEGETIRDAANKIMFGSSTLAKAVQSILSDPAHVLRKNEFLQFLIPHIEVDPKKTQQNDYVEPQFKAMNQMDDAVLVDAYREIQTYDEANNTNLAKTLMQATLLQAGTSNSPFSFLDRIPGEFYARYVTGVLGNYKGEMKGLLPLMPSSEWEDAFIDMWAMAFGRNNSMVPYFSNVHSAPQEKKAHQVVVKQKPPKGSTLPKGSTILYKVRNDHPVSKRDQSIQPITMVPLGTLTIRKGYVNAYAPHNADVQAENDAVKEKAQKGKKKC